jgi:hypothetical protein
MAAAPDRSSVWTESVLRRTVHFTGVIGLACGLLAGVTSALETLPAADHKPDPRTVWARDNPFRISHVTAPTITVENVRLEAAPLAEAEAATILKFDVFNASATSVTDLVLEISITKKPASEQIALPSQILVRPFKIRGDVVLESGYTMNYEMLLRHFWSDCDCVANVTVVSARALPEPD